MRIVVHIDQLILDGVSRTDLPRLQAALERELKRALATKGAPTGRESGAAAHATIDVSRGPEAIGQAIARAAHARIAAARAEPLQAGPPAAGASPPSHPLGVEAKP